MPVVPKCFDIFGKNRTLVLTSAVCKRGVLGSEWHGCSELRVPTF